ncbi:hypothetical protein JIX56_16565 [Streptomyces sp. CA-210063]|uniref:hypothetical protein n=1 Tax=Streptomyces sp. CA-210063 TaxID=2801029 RepID=UPI00214B7CFE|nr:hypothetical protein [Streptomyces sp. CA-210063]UUU31386.1 hypothetical protein JIX56_16565 [Streptomyces sp. CA-210063]
MPSHAGRAAVGAVAVCTAAAAALFLSPTPAYADHVDDPSAQELSDRAQEALQDAKSVRLALTDKSAGTETSSTQPTSMDLALDQDGNCAGSLDMGRDGGSVEIVKQDDEVWMKPDADFWKAQIPGAEGEAAAELFKNRYIHGSTSDALLKGMADTCDLNAFQEGLTDDDSDEAAPLKKGDETTVDGDEVVPVSQTEDGETTTLHITTDSDHHLVKATTKGDGSDITMTFTDYDEPVPSETPSADDSIDVSKLQSELEKI